MRSFIIIGGGASGVLMAAQLLRQTEGTVRIFDSAKTLGMGVAYSTENPHHLLNVRASNMSGFPDKPDDFIEWLQNQDQTNDSNWQPQSFAPRCLYRSYLLDLLTPYIAADGARITVENTEVVDVDLVDGKPHVTTSSGQVFSSDALIIATGNETAIKSGGDHVEEYWSSKGYINVPADQPVAIFGTGLSMIDSVISLLDQGFTSQITAISRRGLLPEKHAQSTVMQLSKDDLPLGEGAAYFLQYVRKLITSHGDWRVVIDGLRPHTQLIWSQLTPRSRASFLRHLRPWWDVYRHRMAPEIADIIQEAKRREQLKIIAAHLLSVREQQDGVAISYRKRRCKTSEEITVSRIIDCRGGNSRFSTTRNPALVSLLEKGLARPDTCDLGLDVSVDLRVIDAAGNKSTSVFAVGPITKGAFWEVTSIPDIRVQVEKLACSLSSA